MTVDSTAWPSDDVALNRVRHTAAEWQLPIELVAGALWSRLAAYSPAALDEHLGLGVGARACSRAEAYAAWRLSTISLDTCPHSFRLRELFRAIYCDLPDLSHILMWLIEQDATLFSTANAAHAAETLAVGVPLAEALGLWWLRRRWIEETMRQLQPANYEQAAAALGLALSATSEGLEERVVALQASRLAGHTPAQRIGHISPPSLDLDGSLQLFNRLRAALDEALAAQFTPPLPVVELLPTLPGASLQHLPDDALSLEQPPHLVVRILCDSRPDCYHALDVVHTVGRLVRAGDAHRWRDYIALPLPNGYRALQTVCLWPPAVEPGEERRFIKFHILTPEMLAINERGAVAATLNPEGAIAQLWRSKHADLTETLHKRYHRPADEGAGAFLRAHPLDSHSQSEPVYCFTPFGEVYFLKAGSTALDFAYRIHTQVGHHAARIAVNGADVAFDHPLANGDLVQVTFDPLLSQLDFQWQNLVRTPGARTKVRAALRRRAAGIHSGRFKFEQELLRQLDVYRHRAPDAPASSLCGFTTAQIDRFLTRATLREGHSGVEALYERLSDTPTLVRHLVRQLLGEQFIPALMTAAGLPLRPEFAHIELCPDCWPTFFSQTIWGSERTGPEGKTLVIHAVQPPQKRCAFAPPGTKEIPLQWAPDKTERWPRYRFTIDTPDGFRVLDGLLEMVYELAGGAYLYRVDASVNTAEKRAHVVMDVNVRLPQLCRDLQLRLLSMGGGTSAVFDLIPSDEPERIFLSDPSREVMIPYTTCVVTDWRFYNRDETTAAITEWLAQPDVAPVLLLHGQRRVGKSSLVRRLEERGKLEQLKPQPVVPVFLDFRRPALLHPASVADHMAQTISRRLGRPTPPRPERVDPFVWLEAMLADTVEHLKGARLLLIIDEFDAELEDAANAGTQPHILRSLRSLLSAQRHLRWLLIVKDAFLADPRFQRVLPAVPFAVPRLAVRPLDRDYARQLIVAPAEYNGYQFETLKDETSIPDRIAEETGGNPFLIHTICRHLLERASRNRRTSISAQDLNVALNLTLDVEGNFVHLTEYLSPGSPRRAIAAFVAHHTPPGRRMLLSAIEEELVQRRAWFNQTTLNQHITFLEQVGVFDTMRQSEGRSVGFPMRLLHRWIRNYINDEEL